MLKKLILLLFFTAGMLNAQVYTKADVTICRNKVTTALLEKESKLPIGPLMVVLGKTFIYAPYIAHTLEKGDKETLVVNLREFDCTTYVENCLVLARVTKMKKPSFKKYLEQLQYERYRGGKIKDYSSRLHYFTDWIYDGQKKGIVRDVTKKIGGVLYNKKIDFMTTHRDAYKQLANDTLFKEMQKIETRLNKRKLYYIPKDSVQKIESKIKDGDIIAITTSIPGLDVSHVAIALKMIDNKIHLLHAPDVGKKVQISYSDLYHYLMENKKQTGIIIARPLEPKK